MRNYYAKWDNGHETVYSNYESQHRNGSRDNKADARRQAVRQYGRSAIYWILIETKRGILY